MDDPVASYIEDELKKGFSVKEIKKALREAGHDILVIEEAIDHVLRKRFHHHLLLFSALLIILLGTLMLNSVTTYDAKTPFEESPASLNYSSQRGELFKRVPVPQSAEECELYTEKLARQVCLEKARSFSLVSDKNKTVG